MGSLLCWLPSVQRECCELATDRQSRKGIQMKFMDTQFFFSVRVLAGINRYTS